MQKNEITHSWHHIELHGHRDDVEADDGGDGQVEVLGGDHFVDGHSRRRVMDVIRRFQHFCKIISNAILVLQIGGVL